MSSILHAGSVWRRLSSLSRRAWGRQFIAVPFFGTGATELLKVREGTLLVTKFDRESVGAGLVNPREIIRALGQGAKVHSCSNLHAKVYVFGRTAVVGSANVSSNSDKHLLEACVETTDSKIVASAIRFVRGLLGDEVGADYARMMLKFYRPPRRMTHPAAPKRLRRRIPLHSSLWLVSLVEKDWQDIDYDEEEKGWNKAEAKVSNPKRFELATFQWSGGKMPDRFQSGERVLQCTRTGGGNVLVSPPARIVSVRRYNVKNQRRAIVYIEAPSGVRRRQLESVLNSLGPTAKSLGNPRRTKLLRDPELIYGLGRVWA